MWGEVDSKPKTRPEADESGEDASARTWVTWSAGLNCIGPSAVRLHALLYRIICVANTIGINRIIGVKELQELEESVRH